MPGPAQKDPSQRARRNATPGLTSIPAEGRGDRKRAPNWPLPADPRELSVLPYLEQRIEDLQQQRREETDARKLRRLDKLVDEAMREQADLEVELATRKKIEREIWTALWRTPMAVEWERLRWTRTVARYARVLASAELGSVAAQKEARALENAHGLTPFSLSQLKWRIAEPVEQADSGRPQPGARRSGGTRRHLRAVGHRAAAGA